jgi:SSS family transporter
MLSGVDGFIIGAYLLTAFAIGLWAARSAGTGLASYFVANRSLPWWWLGTSMVATTFASDTPLVVTGFVAEYGLAGTWVWWSVAVGYVLLAVVFAGYWRASNVITDAELIEIRYEGKAAAGLRAFKAVLSAIITNCIVLGWVFAAMAKITRPFVSWEAILGASAFTSLQAGWPSFLLFQDLDNTLTIFCLLVIVLSYSSAGGIRGVIVTDLLQFTLAMSSAILFAWLAVDHVGGLEGMWQKLDATYPAGGEGPSAAELSAFWPNFAEGSVMSLGVFIASIGVLWWSSSGVDGTGYLAQRLNTAKSSRDAEWGGLLFCFVNFVVRSWPWILVGLVALIVFPLADPTSVTPLGSELEGDREMAYPVLKKLILPSGLLGLVLAGLIAAFMSTVDTHINWGASYLVNDLYKRFVHPEASEKELVRASRISVVLLGIIAIFVAAQIATVGDMWKFNFAMLSGLGVPHILRWLWWRANAWTEISGMATGLVLSVPAYAFGFADRFPDEYVIACIAITSSLVAVGVTFLTPPVSHDHLQVFYDRVKPVGAWARFGNTPTFDFKQRLIAWALGTVSLFSALFGLGWLVRLEPMWGVGLLTLSLGCGWGMLRLLKRETAAL